MTEEAGPSLDVALIEPYYGGSHRAWADGYARHSRHRVRLITHEAQLWRWRMRGGAVTLAEDLSASLRAEGPVDVVLASDMVDVAAMLGLARRGLGDPAVVVFMHENQLTYPLAPNQALDEGLALVNWKSMAVADLVAFNSVHHRDAMLGDLEAFLRRPADRRHTHLLESAATRSEVWPIGVEVAGLVAAERAPAGDEPLVLWNQRWEHDKNPQAVLDALVRLADDDVAFRVAFAGENVRVDPQDFDRAITTLGERVAHVGYLEDPQYRELLLAADVVVSAARHEFFGISVVEAIAAGAVPILPDRLSYPEIVPPRFHAAVLYPDGSLGSALRGVLADIDAARRAVEGLRAEMGRYDWSLVAPAYDRHLAELVAALASSA